MNGKADLHHIQKSVIVSLSSASPQRFSQLQPPRVPNNTFSYHLKKLLDNGYVELTPEGYVATRKALKLINHGSNNAARQSTPIVISMLYITNDAGEILLINRTNRPFQGWYGLPSGMIHLGETMQTAAKRELFEKTTIHTDSDLRHIGVLDFQYIQDETEDIFVHAIAFIYAVKFQGNPALLDNFQTKYGQLSWSKLGRKNILPEVLSAHAMAQDTHHTAVSVRFPEPTLQQVISAPLVTTELPA